MELTKIRNWSDDELKVQETQFSEQLFRIRFQAKLGQNEGVKKLRELRKDIARIKTVAKERTLGIHGARRWQYPPSQPRRRRPRRRPSNHDGHYRNSAGSTGNRQSEAGRRNEKVGNVVSTKMQKTIVVEVEMRKAHPKYKRIVKSNKKFYAHDEQNSARVGDVVRIRESRPLSKLKRWALEEIVRRSSLAQIEDVAPTVG
jgi:small subunit ribosomal protein S17